MYDICYDICCFQNVIRCVWNAMDQPLMIVRTAYPENSWMSMNAQVSIGSENKGMASLNTQDATHIHFD